MCDALVICGAVCYTLIDQVPDSIHIQSFFRCRAALLAFVDVGCAADEKEKEKHSLRFFKLYTLLAFRLDSTRLVCVCHTAGSTSEKGKAVGLEYGKKLRGRQPTYGRTGGPCVCGGGGNEMLRTVLCCVISKISDARG